jgi:hypothetical protein
MVVHVSLSEDDVGETVCSLNLAKRARSIEPNREIPQVNLSTHERAGEQKKNVGVSNLVRLIFIYIYILLI